MSYTPPDAHSVILNFDQPFTPVDSHNLDLNFGDAVPALTILQVDINTSIQALITGSNTFIVINRGVLNASINAAIQSEIYGSNREYVENAGQLIAMIDQRISIDCTGLNDINHLVGVSRGFNSNFKKAIGYLSKTEIPWSKPILRVSNEALFFEAGLVISRASSMGFDRALTLSQSIQSVHENGCRLITTALSRWEEALDRVVSRRFTSEATLKRSVKSELPWQEMLKRRKTITMSHQVAEQLSKHFVFEFDKGLELVTKSDIEWDKAKAIHYRKHPIKPWPKPEIPKYQGDGNLNFICLCRDIDPHNIVLNFGEDDCIPTKPKRKGWHILNSIQVARLGNGAVINALSGTYETSRGAWCWSYTMTVPPSEIEKLQPIDDKPVVVSIVINGFAHHMLLEGNPKEVRRFGETWFTYEGRSRTALDSADYSEKRSFLQENERTSVQLCQAELDRVFSDTLLSWQHIDELGWIVEAEGLSYTNLAPIDAIKLVVEAGGGFVYSEKAGQQLTILPKYRKSHWDPMQVNDYDVLLSSSDLLQHSIEHQIDYDYNGIFLVNSRSGFNATVRRAQTSADVLLEPVFNPMFNAVSMGGFGKSALTEANVRTIHTFSQIVVLQELGEMLPGKILAFDGEWWGVIDSVSGSWGHGEVWETIKVEQISRE